MGCGVGLPGASGDGATSTEMSRPMSLIVAVSSNGLTGSWMSGGGSTSMYVMGRTRKATCSSVSTPSSRMIASIGSATARNGPVMRWICSTANL